MSTRSDVLFTMVMMLVVGLLFGYAILAPAEQSERDHCYTVLQGDVWSAAHGCITLYEDGSYLIHPTE